MRSSHSSAERSFPSAPVYTPARLSIERARARPGSELGLARVDRRGDSNVAAEAVGRRTAGDPRRTMQIVAYYADVTDTAVNGMTTTRTKTTTDDVISMAL